MDVELIGKDPQRANLVARLKGNGSKEPLLLMAHLDVVTVDPAKWTFPPFAGTVDADWIYGRGAVDDKDNLVASLMTMLLLKRSGVVLDRDVIFLAEAGEEGGVQYGIEFMVNEHFDTIDAEFCLAEGGGVMRQGGKPLYAGIQTGEKMRRTAILTANGVVGHGSVPTRSNPVARLSQAAQDAMRYLLDNEPGTDKEDGLLGFGAHSDQERILESELYRFVHAYYEVVEQLAAAP